MSRRYYVYILASKKRGTLYIGVTNNILRRVQEHKQNLISGFTSKYNVHKLVYIECYPYIDLALTREKQLKSWLRARKIELIESRNLSWRDLYREVAQDLIMIV